MPEEVGVILDNLKEVKVSRYGDLELFSGKFICSTLKELIVTTAWSGWGKVSAARAATRLFSIKYNEIPVEIGLFTGVAGAVDEKLKQWDIVFAKELIQHDMDARPLYEKYVIPAFDEKKIVADTHLLKKIYDNFNHVMTENEVEGFGSLHKGLIGTGDMFVSDRKLISKLSKDIKGLLAVEMEGAAFAQVAKQEKIDWLVIRIISDNANEEASDEFSQFLEKYKFRSFELIKCFLDCIPFI